MQGIVFAGCSFTYGEGLDLYCNTEKWIEQRNYTTHDAELRVIGDSDGTNFRLNNNFGGLIGNHFGMKSMMHHHNGGCFASSLRFIDAVNDIYNHSDKNRLKELWKDNKRFEGNDWLESSLYEYLLGKTEIKAIIIQLSCFNREPIHFNYKCKCEICDDTTWTPLEHFYKHLHYIEKGGETYDDEVKFFNHIAKKVQKDFNYKEFCKLKSNNFIDASIKLERDVSKLYKKYMTEGLDLVKKEFIERYEETIAPVYFIDSWDKVSSDYVFENEFYYNRLIPLKSDDDKYYKRWTSWEKNLKNAVIFDDFPKTGNRHPSLHAHKKISESVIEFLNKLPFFKKSNI